MTNERIAPEFSLLDQDRKLRSLSEFRGRKVVLVFYPGAFTSVCTKELCTFRDSLVNFNKLNAFVIGISVDSPFVNKAFADQNNLQFPLLSDYNRTVSQKYAGVYENFAGMQNYSASKRAVFIINEEGKILYSWVSEDPGIEPDYESISEVLR